MTRSSKTEAAGARPAPAPEPRPRPTGRGPRARSPFARTRAPVWHRVVERAISVAAMASIASIALIFLFVAREAVPLFWEPEAREEAPLADLFVAKQWRGYDEATYVWQPVGTPPKYNVVPLFVGTLKVTLIAMLLSVPIGIGGAIFLSQYASRRVRELVKPVVELLAAIPSVVIGFFALMVLASWVQDALGLTFRLNATVAAIGLGLTIVPVVFTVSEDALAAVPRHLTEAAVALGARRYQVALRVLVPAAAPGIAAAIVLGFGRAVGETMIVLMASGNAAVMEVLDPTSSVRTVTATIAAELGEVAVGEPHWRVLFMLGLMLFAVTFVLNLAGAFFVRRVRRKLAP